jgi:hypothetical protein
MRTTIEMNPEHRARIVELAASVANAIRSALALKGSMSETEAAALLSQTRKLRANWR